MKKYVLTGGPGIGKTTVIEILASMDYEIVPEAARIIIEEEQIKNSDALPWANLAQFQKLVVQKQIADEEKINKYPVFLDRSIIDGYAYCILGNVQIPEEILNHTPHRYDKVFLLEQLDQYSLDGIRHENKDQQHKIHQAIIDAYEHFGYDLIHVPVLPPEERVRFILERL